MFLVTVRRDGPRWDHGRPIEGQEAFADHVAFLTDLLEAGLIVLGGPLEDDRVIYVACAESAQEVRAAFASDPWEGPLVRLEAVEPWTVRLDATRRY
jgi:uncharacterized protein YciI